MDGGSMREIRKRFDPALSNIKKVYGCYVTADRSIVTTMEIPVLEMDSEERSMYAKLLKSTVSGPDGRHLHDIQIGSGEDEAGDELKLLKALKEHRLEDEPMRSLLYDRIIETYDNGGKSYFILLAADTYDIKSRDTDETEWSEESEIQFSYFVCSICKVKDPKAALRYAKGPKEFRGASTGSLLDIVMHGFMFPAYIDRQAEETTATYFTKKVTEMQEGFIKGIFGIERQDAPSPELTRKEKLDKTIEAIGSEYTLEAASQITEIVLQKMDEENDTNPDVEIQEIGEALRSAPGMSDDLVEKFIKTGTDLLGASVSAATIVPKNHMFTVSTGDAEVRTAAENAGRISRKKIDGSWCLIIPISSESEVTVNGRKIYLNDIDQSEG